MNSGKPLKTQDLHPPTLVRPEDVRWCPLCRRYRGPGGLFLKTDLARRVLSEARRVRSKPVLDRGVADARARLNAAALFDTPRPAVCPPPTGSQARAARMSALLFDTPMPKTRRRPSPAERRAAHTARLLFG